MAESIVLRVPCSLEEYISYIQERRHASLVFTDQDGTILSCNSAFLQATGYPMHELLNQSIEFVLGSGQTLSEMVEFNGRFSEKELARIKTKSGKKCRAVYQVFKVKFLQEDRLFFLMSLSIIDLNLNLLQRFAGTFMKDVNLGVILIDTMFHVADISYTACRILGMSKESVINKSMDEVFASVPQEHRLVQRTILDGMVIRNHAMSWTNNEQRYELLMDSNLLKDEDGETVGAYVIFKDVSNLRSLEEQVQRSDRLAMIGQIAAGTAHEIRNPLTSIKGFLQVMKKTLVEKGMSKEHQYTEIMLSEIDRINGLVSEFLLLSKPRENMFSRVSVSHVIKGILPIINNEAILHNVTVSHISSMTTPEVLADRELLKQVCLNLCKNGIEAMADGGTLTIVERIDLIRKNVNIEIHDTGPGIPPFLVDKIFDPFFTTKQEGTGLGLSVCQRIIHDMGGNIRVSSKGYGTTFTFSIPIPD